ncbi:MAG: class I fructose-bisphosphate aldolase [Gammaproteobacteria bacterium]
MNLDFSKNQIIIAMDHARYFGVVPGLEAPGQVLESVVDAGADAVMSSYGTLKHYQSMLAGSVPTILRLDGGFSVYREEWLRASEWSLLHTVEDARALGVAGVCVMLFAGSEVELETMEIVARVAGECRADGLPVVVEALPCPCPSITDTGDAKAMANACRLAFEHGADVLKTYYTGSAETFETVTASSPVPTLIAGGPRMNTTREVLEVVRGSVDAGGRGVVFGRNIWQNPDPAAMVAALGAIIHRGGSVSDAMAKLE